MATWPSPAYYKGKSVVFTGRLASMSRQDAIRRLITHGARTRSVVTHLTHYLVIGSDGWPLRSTGKLTRNLLRAEYLQSTGAKVVIVSEAEFLSRLGYSDEESIRRFFTLEQISRMTDVSGLRLRHWIKIGLLRPVTNQNGVLLFEFSQLSAARTLAHLIAKKTTLSAVAKSLDSLRQWLPNSEHLSEHLILVCNMLSVRDTTGRLIDSNGQLHFGFHDRIEELPFASPDNCLPNTKYPSIEPRDEKVFKQAYELELQGRYHAAIKAYQRWLTKFGPTDNLYFNLGNAFTRIGHHRRAALMLRRCVRINSKHPQAWNNLGLSLARLGRLDECILVLERAIRVDPEYEDALYNLADLLDELGRTSEARLLWLRYMKVNTNDVVASYVRKRLHETE